jgi:hypothetical protein
MPLDRKNSSNDISDLSPTSIIGAGEEFEEIDEAL